MSGTESFTQTYTIADIGKVIDCIGADLDMCSQSTGLLTRELVKKFTADVKTMAQNGYLREANIVLKNSSGESVLAAKYEVSTDASTLTAQRPGNNRWPRTPEGKLCIIVRYSQRWRDLTDEQRAAFRQRLGTNWVTGDTDLSFPSLTRSTDRNYVSNGWGVTKSIYG